MVLSQQTCCSTTNKNEHPHHQPNLEPNRTRQQHHCGSQLLVSTRLPPLRIQLRRNLTTSQSKNHHQNSDEEEFQTFFPERDSSSSSSVSDGTTKIETVIAPSDEKEFENSDQVYQNHLKALESVKALKQERERIKNEKMFAAWQRQEEKKQQQQQSTSVNQQHRSSKISGVAIVQTLAKETKKEREQESQFLQQVKDGETIAQQLLERAATLGHGPAMVQCGNQTLQQATEQYAELSKAADDLANEEWEQKATHICSLLDRTMEWYRTAGEQGGAGAAEAWFNLGNLWWTGFPVDDSIRMHKSTSSTSRQWLVPANREMALECFERAMALGDTDAMYFLGVERLSEEVDRDEEDGHTDEKKEKALQLAQSGWQLIQRAAAMGHSEALYYQAVMYLNGHAALKLAPSLHEFVSSLDAAVDAGSAEAAFLRGHCWYAGQDGYERHVRRALDDWIKAALEGNHADASISAGALLHQGFRDDNNDHGDAGGPLVQDQERAFQLYQHAGELGSREGWRNVVACYATGEGVPQSNELAKYIAETMLKDEITDP